MMDFDGNQCLSSSSQACGPGPDAKQNMQPSAASPSRLPRRRLAGAVLSPHVPHTVDGALPEHYDHLRRRLFWSGPAQPLLHSTLAPDTASIQGIASVELNTKKSGTNVPTCTVTGRSLGVGARISVTTTPASFRWPNRQQDNAIRDS